MGRRETRQASGGGRERRARRERQLRGEVFVPRFFERVPGSSPARWRRDPLRARNDAVAVDASYKITTPSTNARTRSRRLTIQIQTFSSSIDTSRTCTR